MFRQRNVKISVLHLASERLYSYYKTPLLVC